MELNIKILEINPSVKNLKIKPTDIISLSFIAENVVVKIDNIEKNILNKEIILLILRDYSPNEKILFNLMRNDAMIIGTGRLTPFTGTKWYKTFDLISITESNVNNNSKNLIKKSNSNNIDSLINSNIKIKLETQVNITKSKSKPKYNTQKINISNIKNKSNLTNMDEKNNSLVTNNISNFNQFQLNKNINSYTATPGIKSPRYNNLLMRANTNNTNNNNNDSSRDNTLKDNNILPGLDFEKEKQKKKSDARRTPSGKKFMYQAKKYKTLYGFNKSHGINKNKSTEKSLDNNIIPENRSGKMSKEIEEKILDKNFQDIIKCDEILRGKEINDFNIDSDNTINKESNKNINIENNNNNNNNNNNINNNINNNNKNNNDKKPISTNKKISNNNTENKTMTNRTKNNINSIITNNKNNKNIKNNNKNNSNQILNTNNNTVNDYNNNNELNTNTNNLKNELNNINQNSAVNSALSSGRMLNSGNDIDLSGDDLSGSFSAYDNISKILLLDEYKISYDIENENITKYENVKNDFILFYNKEYINSINEEMLILELQLMIDKILEMQNIYKRQSIIIQRNFGKYIKKLYFYQKRNTLMNKKMNKLLYEKSKNKYKEEMNDLYYNNRKITFYRNKNIFKTNEQSLWNNLTSYLNEKEVNNKNKIKENKKKFNNIFLTICNKNVNNLNALSKKYVLEFIEKEREKEKKEKEKEKEKEKAKKVEKNNLNNTGNNFYTDNKKKFNDMKNKNSSKKLFKNNNRNDIINYKSNKLLKSNDAVFKKDNKRDILQKETEGDETNLNTTEKLKKVKTKELGGFNNRNLNKNNFNTMKSFNKKINIKNNK